MHSLTRRLSALALVTVLVFAPVVSAKGASAHCLEDTAHLCPPPGQASCLGLGLYASIPSALGTIYAENARSEGATIINGYFQAKSAVEQASVGLVVSQAVVASECFAHVVTDPTFYHELASAKAKTVDFVALNGLITADVLFAEVAIDNQGFTHQTFSVVNLEVAGLAIHTDVAPGTQITVPRVGVITLGDFSPVYFGPSGQTTISAAALRLDTFNPLTGAPNGGTVLVSYAAAAV